MNMYEQKHVMFYQYIRELERIQNSEKITPAKEIWEKCEYYINMPTYNWVNLFNESNELCGFLVIGKNPDCNPAAERYIAEAYIRPEDRMKNIMRDAVASYTEEHKCKYCLFVLRRNKNAIGFWKHVFEELCHYRTYTLECQSKAGPDVIQLGYHPC